MAEDAQKISFFEPESQLSGFVVKVIGIGGGALNILNKLPTESIYELEYLAIDTDADLLKNSKFAKTFCLDTSGEDCTKTVSDFETARRTVLENADDIRELIKDTLLVIIVTCLGGETASSIAPVIATICKERADLTLAFATTPMAFESAERHQRAASALQELEDASDTAFHIPMTDTRLFTGTTPTSAAYARFDEFVVQCIRAINESVYAVTTYGCVDFPDLRALFGGRGRGYAAVGCAGGEERVTEVLNEALGQDNLLLGGMPLKEAKSVWVLIEGGDNFRLDEVQRIQDFVYEVSGDDTLVVLAPIVDEQMGENICLTLLAVG